MDHGCARARLGALLPLAGAMLAGAIGCGGPSTPTPSPTPGAVDVKAPGSCSFVSGWYSDTADAVHFEFDPVVVNPRIPDPVALKVKAPEDVDSVQLVLSAGPTVTLTPSGGNLFCAMLTPSQVLFNYSPDDVQHNFVGALDLYAGNVALRQLDLYINVADEAVPLLTPQRLQGDLQVTPHLANMLVTDRMSANLGVEQLMRHFYETYPDAFDFVNLISTPSYARNHLHFMVRNDVQGIGLPQTGRPPTNGAYGSAGRLLGISRFPINSLFDMAARGGLQEMGHQWMAWLTGVPALQEARPYWPPSTLARGIMGFRAAGQGVEFPFTVTPVGGDSYRLDPGSVADTFNDMELYLMGLAPPESVGPHVILEGGPPCAGCVFRGTTVTVQDVIAAHGPRVPAYPSAPSRFTMASIVVSMDRMLSPREMSFFEYFAARGEATSPVPFSSAFSKGMVKPFALATGGRGTLSTTLGPHL